jgi:O-antigen/teichoic acid export membrane protein
MRVLTALLSLALFWSVARINGADALGEFALVLGLFFFCQQLPLLGLHVLLIRDVAAKPGAAGRHVMNAGVLALGVSLILCLVVGLFGAMAYPETLHTPIWLMALALVPTGLINVFESVLMGLQRLHVYAAVNVGETLVRVAASIAAIETGHGLSALMLIFLVGRALSATAYAATGSLAGVRADTHLDKGIFHHYLRSTPVLLGILLASAAMSRLDVFFLSMLGSLSDVGFYSAPYKIYELTLTAPLVITLVLFPVFAAAYKQQPQHFNDLVVRSLRLLFLAGVPCAVTVGAFAEPLVRLVYGEAFVVAAPVLKILIGCAVLVALDRVLSLVLVVCGRQDLDLRVLAIAAAVDAAALAILVPAWGYQGAAVATSLATVAQLAARFHCVQSRLAIVRVHRSAYKPLTAASIMVGVVVALSHVNPAVAALASLASYGTCLIVLRIVGHEDVAAMRGLLRPRHAK